MKCDCGLELPTAFPGATVTCTCGRAVTLPAARPSLVPVSAPSSGGPYRASATNVEEPESKCPYCGNHIEALVRICPHCDVRLDNVRCTRCFSLQGPGSFSCRRCGQALELEPLLDATDAPCPRCTKPLEMSSAMDNPVHECPRCGGMFIGRDVLAEILCRAELSGPLPEPPLKRSTLGPVSYIPCPLCHTSMNRVNFGKVSGVIVDVCRNHGTWFDPGELTMVIAFAASGGLSKTREREQQESKDERARANAVHAELVVMEVKERLQGRVGLWNDFLRSFLWW